MFAGGDVSEALRRTAMKRTEVEWEEEKKRREHLHREAARRRHERRIGNFDKTVRPNPNVPIGWPSDGSKPAWADGHASSSEPTRSGVPWAEE